MPRLAGYRREALRTNLWLVPTLMVFAAAALFAVTYAIDRAAHLPGWITTESPDAARQVLTAIAAAVITVAGVVFSVTILALQLASQQFGPRMLRNFIRDFGTQFSLGTFVSTFVYSILALGAVKSAGQPQFVPNLSVAVALALTLASLGVLIFFIHHVATSIQLTSVVAGIARDFTSTAETLRAESRHRNPAGLEKGLSIAEVRTRLATDGVNVPAGRSGFLQAISHDRLVGIAASNSGVVELLHRPGHFIVEGQALARVWPASCQPAIAAELAGAHSVGSNRTLTQDVGLAVDQLVEIAIRALSPAVNDTFTALNCIDWLGDGLRRVTVEPLPDGIYRDGAGAVRLIDPVITYERLVKGAFDKVRQAGRGMPAVFIRQLGALGLVLEVAASDEQRSPLVRQAAMILRASEETVAEKDDRADVQAAFDRAAFDRAAFDRAAFDRAVTAGP